MIRDDYWAWSPADDWGTTRETSHQRFQLNAQAWPTIDELLRATRGQRMATMLDILKGTAVVSATHQDEPCD